MATREVIWEGRDNNRSRLVRVVAIRGDARDFGEDELIAEERDGVDAMCEKRWKKIDTGFAEARIIAIGVYFSLTASPKEE
jgi:hypothetical protein